MDEELRQHFEAMEGRLMRRINDNHAALLIEIRGLRNEHDTTRAIVDLDRRNMRSIYDNLAIEVNRQIKGIDAKLELAAERFESSMDEIDGRFDRLEELIKSKE